MLVVGLFGTCGNSRWRDAFIERYGKEKIPYFNPQVPPGTWKESDAVKEAEHLAEDEVILFPVTSETYATGSLSEVGFSILQAIRLDDRRDFVVMVEQKLDDALDDPVARKESLRARALVLQHLKKLRLKNLYVVDDLEDMLDVSIQLFRAAQIRAPLAQFNPHNK
ncbi:MAG: hypothetical protein ABSA74_00630 [Candidatus Staskawiczbacteria bacterium]|jgi:hypothetical protein